MKQILSRKTNAELNVFEQKETIRSLAITYCIFSNDTKEVDSSAEQALSRRENNSKFGDKFLSIFSGYWLKKYFQIFT